MKGKAQAQVQIPPKAMLYSSLCKSRRQKIIFHKESLNPLVSEKMFKSLSLEANEPLNESRNVVALYNIKMLYHLNKQTSFERKGHVQLQSKSIKKPSCLKKVFKYIRTKHLYKKIHPIGFWIRMTIKFERLKSELVWISDSSVSSRF